MNAKEFFASSVCTLKNAGVEDAQFDAQMIFEDFLMLSKHEFLKPDFSLTKEQTEKLQGLIKRRSEGEPLQYILGRWEFYSRSFFVGEGVLIPRDDTEVVLRATLPYLNTKARPKILDLCAGSGILAVTLKCEFPDSRVTAVEISAKALCYLRKNAEYNNADIKIIGESLYDCLEEFEENSLDLLISNPPYIKKSDLDNLQKEVLREPLLALDGGSDGCDFIRGIIALYTSKIKNGGMLAFELDSEEAEYTKSLMLENGFTDIKIYDDLGGIPRAITGILRK